MLYNISENEKLLRKIVKAVEKGVGEDVRDYLVSTKKATNNAVRLMRADNINTNLRDSLDAEIVELKYFKRSAWTGCLIIDRQHKVSFTITTKQTLESIPKKNNRKIPHYLQSILFAQNKNIEVEYMQPTLGDCFPEQASLFSEEEYLKDYKGIMEDDIIFGEGYTHLVVVYEAEHFSLNAIGIKLLNSDFKTAKEYSLDYLLRPDFGELTMSDDYIPQEKDSHDLISVKKELKQNEKDTNWSASIVKPKLKEKEEKGLA